MRKFVLARNEIRDSWSGDLMYMSDDSYEIWKQLYNDFAEEGFEILVLPHGSNQTAKER